MNSPNVAQLNFAKPRCDPRCPFLGASWTRSFIGRGRSGGNHRKSPPGTMERVAGTERTTDQLGRNDPRHLVALVTQYNRLQLHKFQWVSQDVMETALCSYPEHPIQRDGNAKMYERCQDCGSHRQRIPIAITSSPVPLDNKLKTERDTAVWRTVGNGRYFRPATSRRPKVIVFQREKQSNTVKLPGGDLFVVTKNSAHRHQIHPIDVDRSGEIALRNGIVRFQVDCDEDHANGNVEETKIECVFLLTVLSNPRGGGFSEYQDEIVVMSHFRSNMEAERAIEARRWHKPQAVLRPSSRFRKLWKSTTRKAFRNRSLSEVRQYQGTRSLSGPWNGVNGSSMEVPHLRTLMNRCSLKAGRKKIWETSSHRMNVWIPMQMLQKI